MLFVPTAHAAHPGFCFMLLIYKVKQNRQELLQRSKQKDTPEKITLSYFT